MPRMHKSSNRPLIYSKLQVIMQDNIEFILYENILYISFIDQYNIRDTT